MRDDIRKMEVVAGKSINLALSVRGRSALALLDLEESLIEQSAIPMKGRLIHQVDGTRREIPYGREGQFIYSISRRHLNEVLLDKAEKSSNLSIYFSHKLVSCDLSKGILEFTNTKSGETISKKFDAIFGADGAHSRVRAEMLKRGRFNYSQTYIDHGYLELNIPPVESNKHVMEVNYLHIWPRGTFMMIALPNQDGSYTVTLFMPFANFEKIKTDRELINFFQENFPDSIDLIGRYLAHTRLCISIQVHFFQGKLD